ncbi:MAG: T9SS type A sorting domain-containing protein [Bacteroidia bacterium]
MGTDSLGMNSQCPTLNLTLTPVPISISLSPMQMQVFPHTMHTVPGDSAILQPHAHIDSCQVVPVGLQPQSAMEVEVFPNPTSGRVSLNATQAIIRILVIDPLGREVARSHPGAPAATMEIPANGPHWLKIELEDGSVLTRKVVKL